MAQNQNRPNILFVVADQIAASFLPAYGNTIVKTPCIDRLAEQGTVFERAYCNGPLCTTSRFSFMSGKLPSEVGAYDNGSEFPASVPTIFHYLRTLKYRTAISGKMHYIGPDQLHGANERLTPDICSASFAWTANWQSRTFQDEYDSRLFTEIGVAQRTAQMDFDEEVAYRAVGKLYDWAREEDDNPFCLMVSFSHPHDPYITNQQCWDLYDDSDIDLPRLPYDSVEKNPHSDRQRKLLGIDNIEWNDSRMRTIRHAYYSNISYVDRKIQSILSALEMTGATENTIIIFTSDHGEMLGERGLFQKRNFFENAVRIPLIVAAPDIYRSAHREIALVSLIDLLPTMFEMGGGSSDNHAEALEGESLVPFLTGEELVRDVPVYSEVLSETTTSPLLMVRQDNWKFIWSTEYPPMLFDLESDPLEQVNRAQDPELRNIVVNFEGKVHARWDVERLKQEVLLSQQRRLFILRSLDGNDLDLWDDPPPNTGKPGYFRNSQGYGKWTEIGNLGLAEKP